ncbi:hypothetical protein FQN55_003740 [Onygenales sp. PD_40]|nr:hypothetical protein FQN55_003740 [Onygenales sp. PD_40]KAK2793971.1 hypothetical protein FQN52_000303 [Onygenales sp. PD_12]
MSQAPDIGGLSAAVSKLSRAQPHPNLIPVLFLSAPSATSRSQTPRALPEIGPRAAALSGELVSPSILASGSPRVAPNGILVSYTVNSGLLESSSLGHPATMYTPAWFHAAILLHALEYGSPYRFSM